MQNRPLGQFFLRKITHKPTWVLPGL